MDGWVVVLLIVLGITMIFGIRALIITCQNCVALGSTKSFFSDIWNGTAGSIIGILGFLVLCVPVFIILTIVISAKKKNLSYRVETRYAADDNYRKALEQMKQYLHEGMSHEEAGEKVVNTLVKRGANKAEAEESVAYYGLLLALQNEEENGDKKN